MENSYHSTPITKGVYGTSSKIMEEVLELIDAEKQGSKIMAIIECSDIYGALEAVAQTYGLTMEDLKIMSEITKRARFRVKPADTSTTVAENEVKVQPTNPSNKSQFEIELERERDYWIPLHLDNAEEYSPPEEARVKFLLDNGDIIEDSLYEDWQDKAQRYIWVLTNHKDVDVKSIKFWQYKNL